MVIQRKNVFYLISIFFVIANIYWLPFISNELISNIKIFMVFGIIFFYFIFLLKNKNSYEYHDLFILFILFFSVIYNLLVNVQEFKYVIAFCSWVLFYFLGRNCNFYIISDKILLFCCLLFLWVFLSAFIPNLNYKNQLWLDYDFADIQLSSTGFSIARTSWGIGVALLSFFLINFSNSKKIKTLLFFSAFLCVLSTGSRGGMLYFLIGSVFFISISNLNLREKFLAFSVVISGLLAIFLYFSEYLRLSGVDDITTGRSSQYQYFFELFNTNPFFGYYPEGGYSLVNYGFDYSQIHNSWLNFILMYGLIGFIPLLLFIIFSLEKIFFNFNKKNYSLYLLVFCGFFSTLLEPETILSNGYHILVFWFALGFLSKKSRGL